jgi:hypothetical protein
MKARFYHTFHRNGNITLATQERIDHLFDEAVARKAVGVHAKGRSTIQPNLQGVTVC